MNNIMHYKQPKGRHNTEHVLECQTTETAYKIKDNTPNQWEEVVKLYRQNKERRK